jgi:hypothetical protein
MYFLYHFIGLSSTRVPFTYVFRFLHAYPVKHPQRDEMRVEGLGTGRDELMFRHSQDRGEPNCRVN